MMEVVSPFDLVVVPAERVDRAQYWTMSALGVVHVEAGRPEEGQFTPLGEWIRCARGDGLPALWLRRQACALVSCALPVE